MIVFTKLRYQNILSTGNVFTEIDFTRSKSTLIIGENGAGKSTMIEALTFALYGRPFRDVNKPQLLNCITEKKLLVEIEFTIGKSEYMVRRGIKPNVFEIFLNGKMLNQNSSARDDQEYLEKQILKMNFKSFSQIVVLGSANYVPFMKLPAAQRRAVVEDLLDIQVFSVMNSILKQKQIDNKNDFRDLEKDMLVIESKIDMHEKHLSQLKDNNDQIIKQKEAKIEECESNIAAITEEIQTIQSKVEELSEQVNDQEKITSRKANLLKVESQLENKMSQLSKEIKFFHDHNNCPTCRQGIDHDFKKETIDKRTMKTQEVDSALKDVAVEIDKLNDRLNVISELNRQISSLNADVSIGNQNITFQQKFIRELREEIASMAQVSKDTNVVDMSEVYEKELNSLSKQKENLSRERAVMDVAGHILRDNGIKTKLIRQYVPIMNKLINKYLASMDFFVNFELDEGFNETIKSRFRDKFSYASFSEGEKMRIDLSLMFTWRAIAKLRNSASTNLLIMDEVFDSSLDSTGTEEFLKILEALTPDTNTFIISHKGDALHDKFRSVIKFEKHGNFSRIAE